MTDTIDTRDKWRNAARANGLTVAEYVELGDKINTEFTIALHKPSDHLIKMPPKRKAMR